MAVKSGISHTFAAIMAMVLGTIFAEYLKTWAPGIMKILNRFAIEMSKIVENLTHFSIPKELFVPIFIGSLLAFLWGMVYHFSRFR